MDLKLVDAPTAGANVLFDFNANKSGTPNGRWVPRDELELGVPEIDGDIDTIDPLYRPRPIQFKVRFAGTKAAALAQQSAMARAMLNAGPLGRGWLRFQVNSLTQPVWFRTYHPQLDKLSLENVATDGTDGSDLWDVSVVIACEAFAYGARVTIAAQTVTSDPTTGTNPMRLVLPTITGDAPTPLDLIVTLQTAATAIRSAVTVISHASTVARPTIQLPIGGTDGASTGQDTTNGTGAAYIGGAYREVSFATTPGHEIRVGLPNATGMIGGRYRALLRVASTDPASVYRINLIAQAIPDTALVTVQPNGTAPTWVDLGIVNPPRNAARSPNGPTQDTSHTIGLIYASRVSGTGALRLDHLMFVPIGVPGTLDTRTIRAITQRGYTTGSLYIDGTYAEVTSNNSGAGSIEAPGTYPVAVPGAVNTLSFTFASLPFAADDVARTAQVSVAYYPRYALVGDS